MGRFMKLWLIEGFKRKIKHNKAVQVLKDWFHLCYSEADKAVPLITQATVEIITNNQRTHSKKPNNYPKDQKFIWSHGIQICTDDEFKEVLRINRETFSYREVLSTYTRSQCLLHQS